MTLRYERQSILKSIGQNGQDRILSSRVAIAGVGALGSVSADLLARAGVGTIRLIDRDFVELHNLQRQALYNEDDCRASLPKAVAAKEKLSRINSQIHLEAKVADLNPDSIEECLGGVDLILDGTDNFETRFLINDFCLQKNIPWIYGGAVGTEGLVYNILPGEGRCLRCLFTEPPDPAHAQTCEEAGILAPTAHLIASLQTAEALKWLSGNREALDRRLWKIDLWGRQFKAVSVDHLKMDRCPGCLRGEYPYLERRRGMRTTALCGRNAVQIDRGTKVELDLAKLASRFRRLGRVISNDYLIRCEMDPLEVTVFANGRAIVKGTEDISQAKNFYAKYVGV